MATISKTAIILILLSSLSSSLSSPIIDELNQPPPPDFSSTLSTNCLRDPSLRYCNSTTSDLLNIFKSTIVSKHLCMASQNPNCNLSFSFINLQSTPRLTPLYLSFSFFWKYCPTSILSINLSNNSLKGPFPSHVLQCMQIHALDLSHNDLSGHAPLEALKLLTNLSFLNLSYNHFSEITDEKDEYFFIKRFNSSSFIHSGLLLSHNHHGFKVTTSIILLVGVLVFAVSVVGFLGCLFVRRPDYLPSILRRRRSHKYTLAMLKAATGGFSDDNLVAKSERWEIYRGRLRDGTEVVIRVQRGRFLRVSRNAFVEECRVLAMMEHENLVKVLGWCDNRDLRAVVSERTSVCSSVEEWLVGSSPPWNQRLKVCIGVMQGLRYLQQQWPQVGCDLRTANVMLSQELNPLISKFRVGNHENNEAKTVYKFGLFVLEMITNKNPREDFGGGEEECVGWINKVYYHGHSRTLIDEKLRVISSQAYEEMKRAISIGLACTAVKSDSLPTIDEIFLMFSRISASSQVHKLHADRNKELSISSHHGLHIL